MQLLLQGIAFLILEVMSTQLCNGIWRNGMELQQGSFSLDIRKSLFVRGWPGTGHQGSDHSPELTGVQEVSGQWSYGLIFDGLERSQELYSMIHMGSFQLRIFYDSMTKHYKTLLNSQREAWKKGQRKSELQTSNLKADPKRP